MKKNILILCCGHPYVGDTGFGCHVEQVLKQMKLPENVDLMEVGFSACMIPSVIEGMDKMIVVDTFYTQDPPGAIVCLKPEEVPLTVKGKTDTAKLHLIETLEQIKLIGKCPETLFIGVVPVSTEMGDEKLSPEIQSKMPVVIEMIMKEISSLQ
ncbi:MAG: hydrogenase maturation protease [Nitrospirota bacterium]